jgi:hypothetical protein
MFLRSDLCKGDINMPIEPGTQTGDWSLEKSTARLLPWGYGGALTACVLNGIWLACLIFLESTGDVGVQAGTHPDIFLLSVGSAILLTFMQVPILLAFTALVAERDVARAAIGGLFYALYIPINLIAYFSYGRLAPMVHSPGLSGESSAALVAALVEIGHPLGLTGNLPILGYGVLGLGWCMLSTVVWHRSRLWKVAAAFLFASGFLSMLGAVGGFIDVEWLTHCCFLGGVFSLPALALLGISMWKDKAKGGHHAD